MEKEINKTIGLALRQLRKDKIITKCDMLKILGVSSQQLNKYENGTNRISASKLLVLLNELKISFDAFCSRSEEANVKKLTKYYNKIVNKETKNNILTLIIAIANSEK